MSADNWAVCPRCKERHEQAADALRQTADQAYGRLPVEEWIALRNEAAAHAEPYEEQEFREDFEIYGAESGTVKVSYMGCCTRCGLHLEFKHEHPLFARLTNAETPNA